MRELVIISGEEHVLWVHRLVDLFHRFKVVLLLLFDTLPNTCDLLLGKLGSGGLDDKVIIDALLHIGKFFVS